MSKREEHIAITRHARVYVMGEPKSASEVWIVCHGYGQLSHEFIDEFQTLVTPERAFVAPGGLHRFYLDPPPAPAWKRRVGATWMTREDRETDIADYVAYLDRVHEEFVPDGARVRVLGFSQGGPTVMRWGVSGTRPFDEMIVWAAGIPSDIDLSRFRGKRIVFVRGTRDEFYPDDVEKEQTDQLRKAGVSVQILHFNGGHRMDTPLLAQIVETNVT